MLGVSYGELFFFLGATAALIGPKDLPLIARTAGRLAGRAIGYVQLARGHFDNIMLQTQAPQLHKEIQDVHAQMGVISHEFRSVSLINPGPLTRRLVDNVTQTSPDEISSNLVADKSVLADGLDGKNNNKVASDLSNMHTQSISYARFAEYTAALNSDSKKVGEGISELTDKSGLFVVIPLSAESAGMLPERKADLTGSDVVLEAILEANVARTANYCVQGIKTNQLK